MRADWKPVAAAALISGVIFGTAGYFIGSSARGEVYTVSGSASSAAYIAQTQAENTPEETLRETETVMPAAETEPSSDEAVNINTADAEELETLDGIGEVKAEAIIEYREENGDFESIEEITEVSGIGEATLAGIYDDITVD